MTDNPKKKRNPPWSREELILALELYLKEGLLDDHSPKVIELSETLKDLAFVQKEDPEVFRNPNGVAMKLANFAALDPQYNGRGLSGGGKLDKEIWKEFFANVGALESEAAELRAQWQVNQIPLLLEEAAEEQDFPDYLDLERPDLRQRVVGAIVRRRGQPSFRKSLLDAYEGKCAFTGCNAPEALEAAHILGYRGNFSNKVNNGLLLRADVHTLFDLGLLAVKTDDMTCLVSQELRNTEYEELLGREIRPPNQTILRPGRVHLDFHRKASRCA